MNHLLSQSYIGLYTDCNNEFIGVEMTTMVGPLRVVKRINRELKAMNSKSDQNFTSSCERMVQLV